MSDDSSISVLWYALQRNEFLFPILMSLVLFAIAGRPLNWVSRKLKRYLGGLARRPILSCVFVFLLVIGIRVAVLPWVPVPAPWIHDEFSYILLGDTLSHWRVTNPPPTVWMPFESFHVNVLPTYQSMYMPGAQGVFIAVGMLLFHSPFAGVLLGVGAMCAAFLWCYRGWLPPHWAMLGALITVFTYCTSDFWVNSYYGGAVGAAGGALVLGAYGRLWKRRQSLHLPWKMRLYGVLMGIGLLWLANARPYEGFVYSIPFAFAVLWWLYSRILAKDNSWRPFVASLCIVLVLGMAAMMYYFWRSTGNPLLTPYSLNQERYHPTRPFVWQGTRDIHFNHAVMRKFYSEWELGLYARTRSLDGAVSNGLERIYTHTSHFVRWLILPFLLGVIYALRRPRWRVALIAPVMMLLGMTIVIWKGNHQYAAPAACALLLMCLLGLRWMSVQLRGRKHLGRSFARAYVAVYLVMLITLQISFVRAASANPYTWAIHRVNVDKEMNQRPGKHLIIVRYRPDHDYAQEFVYNGYDLENGKVLWAREMDDPAKNQELIDYFKDRQVWLFEADKVRAKPVPYTRLP